MAKENRIARQLLYNKIRYHLLGKKMADIFLSYSHKDSRARGEVRDFLRNRGITVWTDENLTPGTTNWQIAIEKNIDRAKGLVVILSPDAKDSEWVREELGYARNQGKLVFPLLHRGNEKNAVPFGYSLAQWIDIRSDFSKGMNTLIRTLEIKLDLQVVTSRIPKEQPQVRKPASKKSPSPRKRSASFYLAGSVTDYFNGISVAGINLVDTIRRGDNIWIQGPNSNKYFIQKVYSMEINRRQVRIAHSGDSIGIEVAYPTHPGDRVFVFSDQVVGKIVKVYSQISVAGVELSDTLTIGDNIWIRGATKGSLQRVDSMEHDRIKVQTAFAGQAVGVKVYNPIEVGSEILRLPDIR